MSRLLSRTVLLPSRRLFSSSSVRPAFSTGPAPPRLPAKEQEEFERLQKASTGAFSIPRPAVATTPTAASASSTPRGRPQINQSPDSNGEPKVAGPIATVPARGDGEELHPNIRRGAKPEFEGERNPKTGEIGGPKNEPLRWGSTATTGDWSYNGRVTDF